jgi:hypothetical protein
LSPEEVHPRGKIILGPKYRESQVSVVSTGLDIPPPKSSNTAMTKIVTRFAVYTVRERSQISHNALALDRFGSI